MALPNKIYFFEEIVKNENDIVGLVAYSRYKEKKIAKIKDIKRSSGIDYIPSDNPELSAFQENAAEHLKEYRASAKLWIHEFSHLLVKLEKEELQKCIQDAISKSSPKFWNGVWQSVVGTFFFTIFVGLFLIGYHFLN